MQYYIKIFNKETSELVGYYKEVGTTCITRLPKGTKYFNDKESALNVMFDLDDSFVRDKDKKYYTAFASVFGCANREPKKSIYRDEELREENLKDEREAFIRQSRFNYR